MLPYLADPAYRKALAGQPACAGLVGDRVVGAVGVSERGPHRAEAWALLALDVPMLSATRAVKRWLDACPYRRIETWVMCGHESGERWAKMLGFRMEGRMDCYLPDGHAAYLFARVKHGR